MQEQPREVLRCAVCGSADSSVAPSTAGPAYCDDCWQEHQSGNPPLEKSREKSPERSPSSVPRHLSGYRDISRGGSKNGFDVDLTAVRAGALGIPGPKQGSGSCVLPGHAHPAHLYPDGGMWTYWCATCDHGFSLAEVRAIKGYENVPYGDARDKPRDPAWERIRPPGKVEVSRWAELLDYEAGLLQPEDVDLWVPPDLSPTATVVASDIRLLLALRSEKWKDRSKFTYSRRMCRARCRLSDSRARAAFFELRERGVIVSTGKAGRALVYRLGKASEAPGADHISEVAVMPTDERGRDK